MNEFSESSSETRDAESDGVSLSDTSEGTELSNEFSDSGGELLPDSDTASEGFAIKETDDFEIADANAPTLELSEVKDAEMLRDDAVDKILEQDSIYMTPDALARMEGHEESVSIVPYKGNGIYGTHTFENGKTTIEIVRGTKEAMTVSFIHEYQHMSSYHSEVIEKHHKSSLYRTQVGLREKEYMVDRDGTRILCKDYSKNLNEGITQYLTEGKLSTEEFAMAKAMGVYPYATEAAEALSNILGHDAVCADFYRGETNIRNAMESLAPGTYERFSALLDKATESLDAEQRRAAMQGANKILNALAAQKAAEKRNMEA